MTGSLSPSSNDNQAKDGLGSNPDDLRLSVQALTSVVFPKPAGAETNAKRQLKTKLYGLAAGIPLIYAFNMARLILLAFLGVYSPAVFTAIHEYLLQLTFAFFVIFFFLFWIGKATRNDKK